MPTMSARGWVQRFGPEALLALLASLVFLGFLGSVELWGKREQRASAEAIDTIDRGHWLVAQIQCRPRLEKPPLPRWTIAALMRLTGRRDEWMVRLPSALAALGMVGLVYGLGCRLGGREVGLASGLALTSLVFFIVELRQAGNDGPLAFFTTLALYAAWRRLHGERRPSRGRATRRRPSGWNLLFYGALGLGFLTKGPIVVILAGLTVVLYLATLRRLRAGLARLWDGWGVLVFSALALSWPVPVGLHDPNAVRVWLLEMGQKTGTSGISHHRRHEVLAADWFWMTGPWVVLSTTALILPCLSRGRGYTPRIWFPWWWAIGNLVMFCFWSVAKPNYFLPCLPAAALLVGFEWVRLTRLARTAGGSVGPGAPAPATATGSPCSSVRPSPRWSCGAAPAPEASAGASRVFSRGGRRGRGTQRLGLAARGRRRGAGAAGRGLGRRRPDRLRRGRSGREPGAQPPRPGRDARSPFAPRDPVRHVLQGTRRRTLVLLARPRLAPRAGQLAQVQRRLRPG